MIFSRRSTFRFLFPGGARGAGTEKAKRWGDAFARDPKLAEDSIELSRLMELLPVRMENGQVADDPIDPIRLAVERGEQQLAIKLLALGGLSYTDLNMLLETSDDYS